LEDSLVTQVHEHLNTLGLSGQSVRSGQHALIVLQDEAAELPTHLFSQMDSVEKVLRLQSRCPLVVNRGAVSIKFAGGAVIGGGTPVAIAGPCSVEGQAQTMHVAKQVQAAGARFLRGGGFTTRNRPYTLT